MEIQCANKCGNLTKEGSEYCEICYRPPIPKELLDFDVVYASTDEYKPKHNHTTTQCNMECPVWKEENK